MRIAKFIAHCGVCSRRDAEKLIEAGRVQIGDELINSPAINISADSKVYLDGELLKHQDVARLWLYYKPVGLVTTHKDPQKRRTVFSALPPSMPRVMSVGRLDLNSEGLLLLTNSGNIVRKYENPRSKIERCYKVRVYGNGRPVNIRSKRIVIDGVVYRPKLIEPILGKSAAKDKFNIWYKVVLEEGKNREIRKIFEYYGYEVNRLIRVSFGDYSLEDMKPGEIREVKTL